jgi:crotonobetainyl-CoA:carnitine CoA-transferase CaiB-like acyl-CoA transferase
MGDHPTAISLFAAIMTALYRRERTGEGAYVHTNLMANGVWWTGIQVQAMLSGAEFERRPAREHASNALHNLYRSRDGRWFHLVLIPEAKRWAPFLAAIGRPDLGGDPRYASNEDRHRHSPDLIAALDEVFASRDWVDWRAALESHGITCGLVGTLRDIPQDRQMHEAGVLVPIDDPRAGARYTVASPVWVREAPKTAPRLPPALGEHTEEVLREAGYREEEIARLRADGAIP